MKINITGGIGYSFDAEMLRDKLNGNSGDVELHINSPGGDIYDGIEIYNEIKRYIRETGSKVTAYYAGFVASAASYLSMAATERVAYDNSVFMIHNASMVVGGDSRVFSYWAEDLEKTDSVIARAYAKVTGKSDKEIRDLMAAGENNNGTYLYGDEIMMEGFADNVLDSDDGGDKENKTKESKVLYANFVRNEKPKEYDHERIVALVGNFDPNSREAEKIGEETVNKKELLEALKTMKNNNGIDLHEIAKTLGLSDLLITEEQKTNLSAFGEVKALCGDKAPAEVIKEMQAKEKADAEAVREAKFNEAFGPKAHKETGKVNHARVFAETLAGTDELTEEKVNEIKENETFKKLAAEIADVDSEYNRIEKKEDKVDELDNGPVTVTV